MQFEVDCVKKTRKRHAVREMEVDSRFVGGGFKPPAASVKSRGGERHGQKAWQ